MDYGEISKRIDITKYWPAILERLKKVTQNSFYCAKMTAALQIIRPAGSEEVVFTKKNWADCLLEFEIDMNDYEAGKKVELLHNFAENARAIKYLEVQD